MPGSLRSLTLAFIACFLVATLGTGYAIHATTRTTVVALVDRRIAEMSDAAAGAPDDGADDIRRRIDRFARRRDTGDIGFQLTDAAGRPIGGNVALRRRLPRGFSTMHEGDEIRGLSKGRALVRRLHDGLTLTTIAETEPFDDFDAARGRIFLIGFGSILLLGIGGATGFAIVVARRIREMRRTVDAIVDGDMQRRVPVPRGGGEFARQALAFNRMLDRIAGLMRGISSVSGDIAHDLRTPLAGLRGRLALLAAQAVTPALRADIDAAIAQCDRLLAMFAAVMRIVEVEGGDRRAGFAPLDLGALADEIGAMMAPVAATTGHALTAAVRSRLPISGDRQLLNQMLINLIENAQRHTPAGTRIAIAAARVGDDAVVTVSDDGPGIAAEQRALALRRFGRLDASRGRAGHGLGLSLAEAIMRLHRGDIALEDAAPGLRVALRIPIAPA